MSQTRTFMLDGELFSFRSVSKIKRRAKRAGLSGSYFYDGDTLRITLTGNVDALDDLVWTLRDEFGERLREVRG